MALTRTLTLIDDSSVISLLSAINVRNASGSGQSGPQVLAISPIRFCLR